MVFSRTGYCVHMIYIPLKLIGKIFSVRHGIVQYCTPVIVGILTTTAVHHAQNILYRYASYTPGMYVYMYEIDGQNGVIT